MEFTSMRAAEIARFGPAEQVLRINPAAPVPHPGPGQVLIRVHAASINPFDCQRRAGYGRTVLRALGGPGFPLILGRDCAGLVAAVGPGVRRFKVGDAVWAAPDPLGQGTHADYAVAGVEETETKPRHLSFVEAAALPYAGLTAWTALAGTGGLGPDNAAGKRVLVHGGSGGVGSVAIQLLKAWGAEVAATASTRNVALVRELGADRVIDYKQVDFSAQIADVDLVLDTIGGETRRKSFKVLKRFAGAKVVSVVTPALALPDRAGLLGGLGLAAGALARGKLKAALRGGGGYDWAFVETDGPGLAQLGALVAEGRLRPVMDSVLALEDVVAAHQRVESGKATGKVVLQLVDEPE
ncbi:MAG: zinc-binding dehydrogenase [Alphaproteobacteria bacterium]|jgi:NADPH:quinone reductase-like Zn-dependent oxidoreductase|nr:zinc-binding dehydrogenase [Alphaproteobacteria bacterium]